MWIWYFKFLQNPGFIWKQAIKAILSNELTSAQIFTDSNHVIEVPHTLPCPAGYVIIRI